MTKPNPSATFRIHPKQPKIFQFRGKPLVLLCATEHYGAVMNRPFRFERYLAEATKRGQTLTRLFTLFRELQAAVNPYSTCKPESTDYVAPFKRTGPGTACDTLPKYDLSQWNDEFFERFHRFLSLASECGVIVEVVLLSNTYAPEIWALNPLNSANNVNDVETLPWPDYMSCRHPKLFAWQCSHVRKVVAEANPYDNVFFEICNEPGGLAPAPGSPSLEEVDAWQTALAGLIRETEATLPRRHLIAGQQAFAYSPTFEHRTDASFADFPIDIVNVHPLPNIVYQSRAYDMGAFMRKQLHLAEVRDYALATYQAGKPLNYDEDNSATMYRDVEGWTVHRKRAWTTLMAGAHYDMIDFSIRPYLEAGTPESRRRLRTWMQHLSRFIHAMDLDRVRPLTDLVTLSPEHCVASVMGQEGRSYAIYLADAREADDPDLGALEVADIQLKLPSGEYETSIFSPVTGRYRQGDRISGGTHDLTTPAFRHDIVFCIRRVGSR